ncbi:unnamed protein product [Musa hybrid cultivar]
MKLPDIGPGWVTSIRNRTGPSRGSGSGAPFVISVNRGPRTRSSTIFAPFGPLPPPPRFPVSLVEPAFRVLVGGHNRTLDLYRFVVGRFSTGFCLNSLPRRTTWNSHSIGQSSFFCLPLRSRFFDPRYGTSTIRRPFLFPVLEIR